MNVTLEWLQGMAIWVSTVGAVVFLALLLVLSRWKVSVMGRQLLRFAVAIVAFFALVLLGRYVPDWPARQWIRLAVYSGMGFTIWQCVWLLLSSSLRSSKEKHDDPV